MSSAEAALSSYSTHPHMRVLDVRYDLDEVANLIETCFAQTMDEDGYAYLRQMRKSAQDARMLRWVTAYAEDYLLPISGLVWVEDHKIIANLTLIPMEKDHKKIYLIANVAVLPEYRGRGISKQLTLSALEYIRDQGVASAWLQVRDDNPVAIKLYHETGFVERARRTTWHGFTRKGFVKTPGDYLISPTVPSDWETQYRMLLRLYHHEVIWNLPVNLLALRPTWMSQLSRILYGEKIRGYALRAGNEFLGSITWETARTWADNLWPACDAANQDLVLNCLLPYMLTTIRSSRPQSVNYPAGQAVETFLAAGFQRHVTLIWMEARTTSTNVVG